MVPLSRSALRFPRLLTAPRVTIDESVDPGKLGCQRALDTPGPTFPLGYLAHMIRSDGEEASYAAVHASAQLVPVDGGIDHIIREGEDSARNEFTLKGPKYDSRHWLSIKMMRGIEEKWGEILAERIKALRQSLGLKQPKFARLVSTKEFTVSQSLVSRWERDERIPPARVLWRMSELAPESDRQWWRDRASDQAGIVSPGANEEITPSGKSASTIGGRTIPVINPKKVGDLGSVRAEDIEELLHLPANWFPMGGEIRAVRVSDNPIAPMIEGDYVAILDISRRDPDRLVDCVVATRTPQGIVARWLRKDRDVYFLQSVHDTVSPPRLLRHDGEDSIVGQVLKWIADAPHAGASVRGTRKKR